jgi:hypothetical protein
MDEEPTGQILRRSRAAMVERHVALDGSASSMSLWVNEVTVLAMTPPDATAAVAACTCADLELGAHVAQMRTLAPPIPATGGRQPGRPSDGAYVDDRTLTMAPAPSR